MRLANLNPGIDLLTLVRCKAAGQTAFEAEHFAQAIGASDRVQRLLKDVGALTSAELYADQQAMIGSFIDAGPKNSAAFLTMFARGFRKMPIQERMAFMTGTLTAGVVGEGVAKPLATVSFDSQVLQRRKAASLIIATKEVWSDPRAESTINGAQKHAVSSSLDADFFETLAAETDATVFASSGTDGLAAALDVRRLVLSVGMAADGAPFFVAGTEAAARAATVATTDGLPVFAEMSPTGGRIRGVECLVSDGLQADSLAYVNAASFAAAVESIETKISDNASIEMSAAPGNKVTTPTAAQLVSMFQTNSRAALLEIFFGWEAVQPDAIAFVTGISWGGEIST